MAAGSYLMLPSADAAGPTVSAPSSRELQDGTISGVVRDGGSSEVLTDVEVTLRGGTPRRTQVTRSDAQGRYQFSSVPFGDYVVMFAKPGFVSTHFGQTHPFAAPTVVGVAAGSETRNISVNLLRAAAIEGRVVDAKGQPLADAEVVALRVQYGDSGPTLAPVGRKAKTDDRGNYRLFGLDPAEYVIGASMGVPTIESATTIAATRAPGFAMTFFPNAIDAENASRVTVRAAQEATAIDIQMQRVRLAKVSGVVLTSGGVDGALVSLVRKGVALGRSAGTVTHNGAFELAGVAPGLYVLQARALPQSVADQIARTGSSSALTTNRDVQFGVLAVEVAGADVTGLNLQTFRGGHMKGSVNLGGEPYRDAGFTIAAIPANVEAVSAGPTAGRVSPDGTFELGGLLGTFILRLNHRSGKAFEVSRVTQGGADVTDSGIVIRSDSDLEDVVVELSSTPSKVSGRTAPPGRPAADAQVLVFAADERFWSLPATRYIAVVDSRDGAFEVIGLPAGNYYAVAVYGLDRGRERDPDLLRSILKSNRSTAVTVRSGQHTTIQLLPPS